MTEYVVMNIRLPKHFHNELKRLAIEENKSLEQVLRAAVAQYLDSPTSSSQHQIANDDDPLWLIGTDPVDLGVTDASVNHDLYLYGPLSASAKSEIKDA